ncbi:Transient receptor potential cation channel subfamily V member 6 [Orchesella cincta]|uniref:Transient receptor potential cation channel subfamily V member 6 n=1 Tax=Orchesella cincta TaxID=48709 RepID=A0A1D2MTR1_ORCCI|nr:Transient receptor potential cation channel subfamily V member 6 [Orchesella cincta]
MGNANSNVTEGVKAQAGVCNQKLYTLVNLKGEGILVDLTKQATTTKNYAALDEAIKTKVEPFLYNKGEGKLFHITSIVLMRNKSRPKHKQLLKNEADYDNWKEPVSKDPKMYRRVCWRMDELGAVGESLLHLCLLCATSVHAELAKRLIKFYPNMINDIYMSDEYWGENVLHMAIVNEDFPMVKFLVDNNVNLQERCTGAFMGPEDQKSSRSDSLEYEWIDRDPNTNYDGHVYWGEYPHCFAACLGQEECYRLILAKGANPNAKDTNGNTILHILVIHRKQQMFDMAYELGAELGPTYRNNLNLTPLTIAAKLARKELFFHILNIEREIYWQIGSVTCAAYPLTQLDTIDPITGGIQKESALNLIVFGETTMHLDLLEGPVMDLLHAKWNTFVKFRFYRQFVAFFSRPIHAKKVIIPKSVNATFNSTAYFPNQSNIEIANATLLAQQGINLTTLLALASDPVIFDMNETSIMNASDALSTMLVSWGNVTDISANGSLLSVNGTSINGTIGKTLWFTWSKCLEQPTDNTQWARLTCECLMFLGAIAFLLGALRECQFLGASMFFENLATCPSRVLFLVSCHLVILMAVLRFLCLPEVEDLVAVVVMMTTAPFFLFFCRGFKTVGPFVVMIYRMLSGDLLRFVTIYLIFVMGFSQAYYIIFLSYKSQSENPLGTPAESVVSMFMVSLSSFDTMYEAFKLTSHDKIAKILFSIYMAIVAILLINMLIAMMGNTYTKIAETANEWQRQWARIVLVVERGVSPKARHHNQGLYSQPMGDSTRALVLRLNQSEDEKEEMRDLLDLRRYHDKAVARRMNKLMATKAPIHRPSIANSLLSVKVG